MGTSINKNIKHTMSQAKRIGAWLKSGRTIDREMAFHTFGCFELSARICELRKTGMIINTRDKVWPSGVHGVEYYIPQDKLSPGDLANSK